MASGSTTITPMGDLWISVGQSEMYSLSFMQPFASSSTLLALSSRNQGVQGNHSYCIPESASCHKFSIAEADRQFHLMGRNTRQVDGGWKSMVPNRICCGRQGGSTVNPPSTHHVRGVLYTYSTLLQILYARYQAHSSQRSGRSFIRCLLSSYEVGV